MTLDSKSIRKKKQFKQENIYVILVLVINTKYIVGELYELTGNQSTIHPRTVIAATHPEGAINYYIATDDFPKIVLLEILPARLARTTNYYLNQYKILYKNKIFFIEELDWSYAAYEEIKLIPIKYSLRNQK